MELADLDSGFSCFWDTGSQWQDDVYSRSEADFAAADAARDALVGTPVALRERQTDIRENFLRSIGGSPRMGVR